MSLKIMQHCKNNPKLIFYAHCTNPTLHMKLLTIFQNLFKNYTQSENVQ